MSCSGRHGVKALGCVHPSGHDRVAIVTGTPVGKNAAESVLQAVKEPTIVDRPVVFDSVRLALTREYAKLHYGNDKINIEPRMVVIHWISSGTLSSAFDEFNRREILGREYLRKQGRVNVAAHLLVDRDGTVYRLMPETLMGRHAIGLNHCAIGVENVGCEDLTDAQLNADAMIVRYLVARFPTIEYLIGHREYGSFRGSRLFVEMVKGYYVEAGDPDRAFLGRLRREVSGLCLDSLPRPCDLIAPARQVLPENPHIFEVEPCDGHFPTFR
jgi:hypothetical protein